MRGVNVEIMGHNLVVVSDDGDAWAQDLAAAVDQKIKDIRASSQTANSFNLVILAALNFAEELERLRRDHKELLSHLEALNQRLSKAMDGLR